MAADNTEAIRFYERFGFVGTEFRRSYWKRRAGSIADALTMTLASASCVPHASTN
ncbi:hypothetical protein [Roseobacter sp. HKCCD8198]|uniref:hypothetical protein n=1 Tax=unclassified Roseobacter TaxID=196798 RepID=UPI00345F2418